MFNVVARFALLLSFSCNEVKVGRGDGGVGPSIQAAGIEQAPIESVPHFMEAVESVRRTDHRDWVSLCRRIAACPVGSSKPCASCEKARFPCVSDQDAAGCSVVVSCGEEVSLGPKGVSSLNVCCF